MENLTLGNQDDGFAWCKNCKKPLKLSDRSPSNLFSHVNQHPEYEKKLKELQEKAQKNSMYKFVQVQGSESMSFPFYTKLVLIEYVIMIMCFSTSTFLYAHCLLVVLRAKIQAKIDYSPLLLIFLIVAFFICFTAIFHVAYMLIFWNADASKYNAFIVLYTGIPQDMFREAEPAAIFFLILDRICVIKFVGKYGNVQKRILAGISVVLCTICGTMTTVWYFKYLPTESNTTCYAFGCVAGAGVDVGDHIEWIAAIFNIVSTIVFGFCIRSFNRNGASLQNDYMKRRKKAANQLVLISIGSILLFGFIPMFLTTAFDTTYQFTGYLGPYGRLLMSLEELFTSTNYWRILCKKSSPISVPTTTTVGTGAKK